MLFNDEFSISVIQLSEMVPILQVSVVFVVGLCFVFHLWPIVMLLLLQVILEVYFTSINLNPMYVCLIGFEVSYLYFYSST